MECDVASTCRSMYEQRVSSRCDLAIHAIPRRQFHSEISRVLDNVDEFSEKKTRPFRRKSGRSKKPQKTEEGDWSESPTAKLPEEWGTTDTQHDHMEAGMDPESEESVRSDSDSDSYYKASSISVLSEQEKESILPLIPAGEQAGFYAPSEIPAKLAWWGTAFCGSILFSGNGWLAGLFLTSPLLVPWCLAGLRNWDLQSKSTSYVGIWHCQILNVEVLGNETGDSSGTTTTMTRKKLIRLLIGDPWKGGVRVEMVVPRPEREQPPSNGELCDLLVLSDREDFAIFKVVREAFFPRTRRWLAEYPFIHRETFYKIVSAIRQQQNGAVMNENNW
eukprot:g3526.t1